MLNLAIHQVENEVTPCTNVCRIEYGRCTGCNRTLEHIENWINYSLEEKFLIMEQIARK